MYKKLKEISKTSYCPYSNFPVAAILKDDKENEYIGVNIENSAFPSSLCAEKVAIANLITNKVNPKSIKEIHIFSSSSENILSPCGSCRQVLIEHLSGESKVFMYDKNGNYKVETLDFLVPYKVKLNNLRKDNKNE